VAETRDWNTYI